MPTELDSNVEELLFEAIKQRWHTRREQSDALSLSPRQLARWEHKGEMPRIIKRLVRHGIIKVTPPNEQAKQAA